ncbi:hypothetical protein [Spongiactinospora sp. 9N601]|uniref:WD40 repeat domain-containing protein n=1 Tax=Spongiactinospora sp. 9N601 TaxID=3375149 RepID=UPI0037A596AF
MNGDRAGVGNGWAGRADLGDLAGLTKVGEMADGYDLTERARACGLLTAGAELVVVVDELEEVFTRCADAEEQVTFIAALLSARRVGSRVRVVAGMRASAAAQCAAHRELAAAVRSDGVAMPPLRAAELREVVVKPAAAERVMVEPALVATIVADAGEAAGALPLVSAVLAETYWHRTGRSLTLSVYHALGGIGGSAARLAEDCYTALPYEWRWFARRLLLRLVTVDEHGRAAAGTLRAADLPAVLADSGPEAVSGVEVVSGSRAAPASAAVPGSGVVPDSEAAPGLVVAPASKAVPGSGAVSGPEVVPGTEAIPGLGAVPCSEAVSGLEGVPGSEAGAGSGEGPGAGAVGREVLERLARARVVTVDEQGVRLAHEAVIGAWPRMQDWLERDRAGLRTHRHLAEAAATWRNHDGDPDLLYRGGCLTATRNWAYDDAPVPLTDTEREFLEAGITAAEAEQDAACRTVRRLGMLSAALALLLILASGAAVVAGHQHRLAERRLTEHQSRDLARQAGNAADAGRALELARQAYRRAPTVEARSALLSIAAARRPTKGVAYRPDRPDRRMVAIGHPAMVELRDPVADRRLATLPVTAEPSQVAFSPDGRTLLARTASGYTWLWDVRTRALLLSTDGCHGGLAFTPSGDEYVCHNGMTVTFHDIPSPSGTVGGRAADAPILTGRSGYGPGRRHLASLSEAGEVAVWDTARRTRTVLEAGREPVVRVVAFSPDGRLLAAADDRAIRLWDLADQRPWATLTGHTGTITGLAFHPDGTTLASADADRHVITWPLRPETLIR